MRNKKIIIAITVTILLLILAYAGYTARHLLLGPQIILSTGAKAITVTSQVIELSGKAENTTSLTMNNAKVLLNETGDFTERMLLSVGMNTFIFDAKDKFGRQSHKTLQVLYTPQDNDVLQLKNDTN